MFVCISAPYIVVRSDVCVVRLSAGGGEGRASHVISQSPNGQM